MKGMRRRFPRTWGPSLIGLGLTLSQPSANDKVPHHLPFPFPPKAAKLLSQNAEI